MRHIQKTPIGYTVTGIIGLAGGPKIVAEKLDIHVQSVLKWRYIPSWHAQKVAILAGLPLEIVRPDMVSTGHEQASKQ